MPGAREMSDELSAGNAAKTVEEVRAIREEIRLLRENVRAFQEEARALRTTLELYSAIAECFAECICRSRLMRTGWL